MFFNDYLNARNSNCLRVISPTHPPTPPPPTHTHTSAHFFDWGGQWYVCAPPPPTLLTPHFYFPLELYVYITLTNNYLAFFIYQLIILWTISINGHRWLLLNNHTSKYNSFILVLYRRYKNHVSVCPPPPPPPTHTFWHIATPLICDIQGWI